MLISNFSAFALTRAEMKDVRGGCGVTATCHCHGGKGKAFTGTYWVKSDLDFYISHYCSGSGVSCEGKGKYC